MLKLTLSPTDHSRDLPPELLGEIIPWLSKDDLLHWTLVNREILKHAQRALYRSLQVAGWEIDKLMKTSSQYLVHTKHLRIPHNGYFPSAQILADFLKTLIWYGQLCTFELIGAWRYGRDTLDDLIRSACKSLLTSLPSLKKIVVMDLPFSMSVWPDSSYLSFLQMVMPHPALHSLTLGKCHDAIRLLRRAPKSSPLISLGVHLHVGIEANTGWEELSSCLDLTQLRHLSLRWTVKSSYYLQKVLREKLRGIFDLPNLTHLYIEVDDAPFAILSQFAGIQHLVIAFASTKGEPFLHLASSLSELEPDSLQSFRVYIPQPWAVLSDRTWTPFFKAFKRFKSLRSTTIYFAQVVDPKSRAASRTLMNSKEKANFINSIKTKSLVPSHIHIIQKARISDVRIFN